MHEVANQADERQAVSGTTRVLAVAVPPIRLDLLGLVISSQATRLELDAERGDGKLLGNLVWQLLPAMNQLDLAPVADEFMKEAGGTLKSFAHLASGRKLEQGAEVGRILSRMAGQKAAAGLHRLFRRAPHAEPAS